MSNSRKKTPIVGNTHADSDRQAKTQRHHQTRMRFRAEVARPVDEIGLTFNEHAEKTSPPGPKGGKHYLAARVLREGERLRVIQASPGVANQREAYQELGK